MARRRGSRRRRGSAAVTGAGAHVLAVERGSAAPETADGAATPSRRRNWRRPRRRRGRSAGGVVDEAAVASERTEALVSGSAPQPSCYLQRAAASLSDSVLHTATEKIMNLNKTGQRKIQAGNKAQKVSVADGAACSSLAHLEPSVRETEASMSKLLERSGIRFPANNCTAQGIDDTNMGYHNIEPNFPEMKTTNLSGNLEEVYQNRIWHGCTSLQKPEEYNEDENGASLSSISLKGDKKRIRKKRGGKRHNRCKITTSQDPTLTTAADNSCLMTIVSENNTSGLEPKGQRKEHDQNKVPIASLVPADNQRSEAYGVNLDGAIKLGTCNLDGTIELGTSNLDGPIELEMSNLNGTIELGMNSLDGTFEKRFEVGESSLDCTNMERTRLQEQDVPCKSNHHDANYLSPSCLAKAYLDGTIKKRFELGTSNYDRAFEDPAQARARALGLPFGKGCELGENSTNLNRNGLQGLVWLKPWETACAMQPLPGVGFSLPGSGWSHLGVGPQASHQPNNANYLSPYCSSEAYLEQLKLDFLLGRPLWFPKKKLLILDLNGLLADINEDCHNAHMADAKVQGKLVFRRPYCDDFLNFCALNFELGVWSSRKKENVASVVDIVMRDFKPCLLFCWDMSKCTFTGRKTLENMHKPLMLKELRKLWNKEEPDLPWEQGDYSASNTVLVDDSPYKALRNPPHTAIFPHSYSYLNWNDNSLGPSGDLRVYLQNLAAADDVQCFVRNNPFGQPFITESDPHWNFYAKIARKGSNPLTY